MKRNINTIPLFILIENKGIEMIGKYPDDEQQYLEFNGKRIVRPNANKAREVILEEFEIDIHSV